MIYTKEIQKAVHYSIHVHEINRPERQLRKGKDVAYITHPLTVGLILARSGASDVVVMAGVLHDVIEDSHEDHKVTKEQLSELFGSTVAALVADVSENDKSLSWEARKEAALEHIRHFSHDALMVKSADILGNSTELIHDYEEIGDAVFDRFNAPKEHVISNTLRVVAAILEEWQDIPLKEDLLSITSRLESMLATSGR